MSPETLPLPGLLAPSPNLPEPPLHHLFLSYSRKDLAFARDLKNLLYRGGFDVWMDEERILVGRPTRSKILGALRSSGAILCLVSRNWLESDYCDWEAEVFSNEFGKQRLMIPLLRVPHNPADLPVYFNKLNALAWPHPEPSAGLYWLIRCALLNEEQGPENEWLERGREALSTLRPRVPASLPQRSGISPEEEARRRARWGYSQAAWSVGRDLSWHRIVLHASSPRHEALFIQGASIEAPELFLDAVEYCLPKSPQRRAVSVPWDFNSLPRTTGEFRVGLATALDCPEPHLERALRDWLWDSNLVLVHRPVLQEALEEEPLQFYYRSFLPQLLASSREARGYAKIVQGVAWTPSQWLMTALARLTTRLWPWPGAWAERALEERRARNLMAKLKNLSHPLPLIPLPPLEPITREHVESWSETLPSNQDRAAIVREILRGARTSAEILARVAQYYATLWSEEGAA